MIFAAQNAEEAIVSPVGVPRVADQPVGHLAVTPNAPAEYADGMTAQCTAMDMLINARLVENEILVHSECTLNRAVGHDFALDIHRIFVDRVGLGTEVLIFGIINRIGRLTLMLATRCLSLGARRACAINMMLTRFNLIRTTALGNYELDK